eukprot:206699_1
MSLLSAVCVMVIILCDYFILLSTAVIECGNEETIETTSLDSAVIYSFSLPSQYKTVLFTTCYYGSLTDTIIELYDSNLMNILASNDNSNTCDYNNYASTIVVNNTLIIPKTTYYLSVSLSENNNFIGKDPKTDKGGKDINTNVVLSVLCYNDSTKSTSNTDCTRIGNDICYIDIDQLETNKPTNIKDDAAAQDGFIQYTCDSHYPTCVITSGINNDVLGLKTEWHCPSNDNCNHCIVNCITKKFCDEALIYGHSCTLLEINFSGDGDSAHEQVTVFPPGNNGSLLINVYNQTVVYNTRIDVGTLLCNNSFTNDITLNVAGSHGVVQLFNMNAFNITGNLNINCNGSCKDISIVCPHDLEELRCNLRCIDRCENVNVDALDGIDDVNWMCNNENQHSCTGSRLYCGSQSVFGNLFSSWIWNETTGWKLDNENCRNFSIPKNITTINVHPLLNDMEISLIIIISSVLFIIIIFGLVYYYRYQREKQSMYITNSLVLLIAIGQYDDNPTEPEIDGMLTDLNGLEYDIKNMTELFGEYLHYDIYPNDEQIKTYWTEQQLKYFLQENAKYLQDNIGKNKNYDGLIVVISCHGIQDYIMTSDYKKFSKLAVHRIFSESYPTARNIPRFFLYDCCSGDNQKIGRREEHPFYEGGKTVTISKPNDNAKQVDFDDIHDGKNAAISWADGEKGPDYRLATVQAANPGFQSRLRTDIGSYAIYEFYKKTMQNLMDKERRFIHEIFDDIQTELHNRGKQHPISTWNDNTRYIRFKCNNNKQNINDSKNGKVELNNNSVELNTLIPDEEKTPQDTTDFEKHISREQKTSPKDIVSEIDELILETVSTNQYSELLTLWGLNVHEMEENGLNNSIFWKQLNEEYLQFRKHQLVKIKKKCTQCLNNVNNDESRLDSDVQQTLDNIMSSLLEEEQSVEEHKKGIKKNKKAHTVINGEKGKGYLHLNMDDQSDLN